MPLRIASASPRSPLTSCAAQLGQLRGLLGVADQADDLVAALAQLAHDLAADEPRSSRDEDLHGRQSLSSTGAAAYNRVEWIDRRNGRSKQTRYAANGAGVSNPRARQRALAIGIVDGREDGDPLAELKELLRTAGVATAGEAVQQRAAPDPDRYLGRGKLAELKAADRRLRRQPGRLRRRAGAAPGAQPRGGAGRAGDRPHRGDPRHLRRPRPLGRGQAAGRAGPARVQPGADAGALDPPRAARRRDRHQGPGREPDRDRPPPRPRPDRRAAPAPRRGWSATAA